VVQGFGLLASMAVCYVLFNVFSQGWPEIPSFDEVEGFGLSRVSSGWDVVVALEYLSS
jgi:hypothetical protein